MPVRDLPTGISLVSASGKTCTIPADGDIVVGRKYVLDPRDFGCPWDGVQDDLPGLDAMIASIPLGMLRQVLVQLPEGYGYCSDNWRINRNVEIKGSGKALLAGSFVQNGIKFPTLRGIILDGSGTAIDAPTARGDHARLKGFTVFSKQCVVTDEGGNIGDANYFLSTTVDVWSNLPATVPLGSVVLRSGATVGSIADYYNDGATRNTTHVVMFRCTTSGTKGSGEPASFATAGISQLGTTITATSGTAVWTVESIPKDYLHSHTYAIGERVVVPGDNDHVFECVAGGTSISSSTLNFDQWGYPVRVPPGMVAPSYRDKFYDIGTNTSGSDTLSGSPITINVTDTTDFAASGNLHVWTGSSFATVAYTGKTSTSFTGCTGTGTFTSGAQVGQGALKWKHIPASVVTMLANWGEVEDCALFGATGAAWWATGNAGIEEYPSSNGATGGADFWGIEDCLIGWSGAGITTSSNNAGGGESRRVQHQFLGGGRTNVDAAAYFNFASPKWGNSAHAVKDRAQHNNLWVNHYIQFSGGMPYRNDLFGPTQPSGNFGRWDKCIHEVNIAPKFLSTATVTSCLTPSSDSDACVVSGEGCSNVKALWPTKSNAAVSASMTIGPSDGLSVLQVAHSADGGGNVVSLTNSDELSAWPGKWWAFGRGANLGYYDQQAFAIIRPGVGAKWPDGTTSVDTGTNPFWVSQSRLHIGVAYSGVNPASIGFFTAAPSSEYFAQGSIANNKSAAVGSPLGWVNTVAGSAGTWVALPALDDAATGTTRQTKIAWTDDAVSSPTAIKSSVYSGRVTAATSATTADQVIGTIPLNNNTAVILDATIKGKVGSSTSGATGKLSGSFTRDGATVTRLGTDDASTVKGTGAAGTPTFDLNINSTSIEVRVTPSSNAATDWSVVYQLDEVKN